MSHSFLNETAALLTNNLDSSLVPDWAITCVYPLSGQYGFLSRILYYASLLAVIFLHRQWLWLMAGAGATAMTYSGTAALHAFILVAMPREGTFDVDAIGAYLVTSTGLILVVPIMSYSATMWRHSLRHLIRAWAVLMTAGTGCAAAAVLRDWVIEQPCVSDTTRVLLTMPPQLSVATFNCTYACFAGTYEGNKSNRSGAYHDLIRGANETMAVPIGSLDTRALTEMQSAALVIAALTVANFLYYLIMLAKGWNPGSTPEGKRQQPTGLLAWLALCPVLISPLLLVANVTVAEIFFHSSDVVRGESIYAVGEWGVMVATALVVIGTCLDRFFDRWDTRRGDSEGGENHLLSQELVVPSKIGSTDQHSMYQSSLHPSETGYGESLRYQSSRNPSQTAFGEPWHPGQPYVRY